MSDKINALELITIWGEGVRRFCQSVSTIDNDDGKRRVSEALGHELRHMSRQVGLTDSFLTDFIIGMVTPCADEDMPDTERMPTPKDGLLQ
jgi:hypothetical protein